MSQKRASIFGDEPAVTDFDVSGFAPKKPETKNKATPVEAVRIMAEASNFPSREVPVLRQPVTPIRESRRHRTGRNVQLNMKVKQETIGHLYRIADSQGWVLGETLEKALAALEEKLAF